MLNFNSSYTQFRQMNFNNVKKENDTDELSVASSNAEKEKEQHTTTYAIPDGGILTEKRDYYDKKEARNSGRLEEGDLVGINGKEYWYINGRFILNKG